MPRPALTDEQRQHSRRNIRRAAAELYAAKGLSGISVRAVAQLAGVSTGTVYSHFGSLSELMQSLWRRPAAKLLENMVQIAEDKVDPTERLRSLLRAYVDFSEEHSQIFRSAFLFVRPPHLDAPKRFPLAKDRFFCLFANAISQGQQAEQFRQGDPLSHTQLVLAAVHGALALPVNLHRLALQDGPSAAMLAIDAQLQWLQIKTE